MVYFSPNLLKLIHTACELQDTFFNILPPYLRNIELYTITKKHILTHLRNLVLIHFSRIEGSIEERIFRSWHQAHPFLATMTLDQKQENIKHYLSNWDFFHLNRLYEEYALDAASLCGSKKEIKEGAKLQIRSALAKMRPHTFTILANLLLPYAENFGPSLRIRNSPLASPTLSRENLRHFLNTSSTSELFHPNLRNRIQIALRELIQIIRYSD